MTTEVNDSIFPKPISSTIMQRDEQNLLQNSHVSDNEVPSRDPNLLESGTFNRRNNNEERHNSRGWTPVLVLASAVSCLGSGVPTGYNIGVMNNAALIMQDFCNKSIESRYGILLEKTGLDIIWSVIVSIFLIGGVTGSITARVLSDKLGRRGALSIGNICGILGATMFIFTPILNSVELFLIARLMVGLSGGLATSLIPTYVTEVAPLNLRGSVGVLCQLGITCGVLLGQIAGLDSVLGTEDSWNIMLSAFLPLCLISLILIFFLPESPKYLFVIKEDRIKALDALSHFRNMDIMLLQREIAELEAELTLKSSSQNWSFSQVFKDPSFRLPLLIVCILQFGQQLSGINAVFYYSNVIFSDAGLNAKESQFATIGCGLANIFMAIISVPIMSIFGRRTLLLTSAYSTIGCLIVLCFSINYIKYLSFMPTICIIAVIAFVTFYGIGLGPIPYFIGSELFEVGPKSAAMSIGSVCNWGGNFFVGMFFTLMQNFIGSYSFLIFAASTLFVALFSRTYLPETQGKTTTENASSITRGLKSRPNDNAS